MSIDAEDIRKFAEVTARFDEAIEKLNRPLPVNGATINVSAGGVGLWIAVTCCVVMLIVTLMGGVLAGYVISEQKDQIETQNDKINRMQDYLNAIYMQAPHLRPKEEKKS